MEINIGCKIIAFADKYKKKNDKRIYRKITFFCVFY